jgi:putative hemolysin
MPGQYSLLEFAKYFNIDLSDEQHTKFTTVAGLVINKSNEVPKIGDKIQVDNYEIEVIDKDRQKIDKLLVTQL